MVQWSPDTKGNAPGGYRYDDHTITGFSLTHLSGAGCRIFGDVPFLPTAAALDTSPAASLAPYDSGFSHASESASPGDYSVTLTRWSIGVELTTTVRAGMGALRYPAGAPAHLLINAGHSANGTQRSTVSVIGSNQVTGSATSGHFCGHPGSYTVHFAVQFDHPFRVWSVWNGSRVTHHGRAAAGVHVGASVGFGTPDVPTTVLARVGISFVSVGNALANLRAEIPGWSFDTVRSAAADAWNAALNRIQVSGGTAAERGESSTRRCITACCSPASSAIRTGSTSAWTARARRRRAPAVHERVRMGRLPQPDTAAGAAVPAANQRHRPVAA